MFCLWRKDFARLIVCRLVMTVRRSGDPGFVWARASAAIWNNTANSASVRLVSSVSVIDLIVFSSLFRSRPSRPLTPRPRGSGGLRREKPVRRRHEIESWRCTASRSDARVSGIGPQGKEARPNAPERPVRRRPCLSITGNYRRANDGPYAIQ